MAKQVTRRTANGRLEEALVALIQNQAAFLRHLSQMDERFARADERSAKMDERFARIDERFGRIEERIARIETELEAIKTILMRHEEMLQGLPEAIRQKIGFKQ